MCVCGGGLHFCVHVTVWRGYYDTYKVLPGSLVCVVVNTFCVKLMADPSCDL